MQALAEGGYGGHGVADMFVQCFTMMQKYQIYCERLQVPLFSLTSSSPRLAFNPAFLLLLFNPAFPTRNAAFPTPSPQDSGVAILQHPNPFCWVDLGGNSVLGTRNSGTRNSHAVVGTLGDPTLTLICHAVAETLGR